MRQKFDQFMATQVRTGRQGARAPEQEDALYRQFLKWKKTRPAEPEALGHDPAVLSRIMLQKAGFAAPFLRPRRSGSGSS
jgi:hypothetical protein